MCFAVLGRQFSARRSIGLRLRQSSSGDEHIATSPKGLPTKPSTTVERILRFEEYCELSLYPRLGVALPLPVHGTSPRALGQMAEDFQGSVPDVYPDLGRTAHR